jgi:hypothetical protein
MVAIPGSYVQDILAEVIIEVCSRECRYLKESLYSLTLGINLDLRSRYWVIASQPSIPHTIGTGALISTISTSSGQPHFTLGHVFQDIYLPISASLSSGSDFVEA